MVFNTSLLPDQGRRRPRTQILQDRTPDGLCLRAGREVPYASATQAEREPEGWKSTATPEKSGACSIGNILIPGRHVTQSKRDFNPNVTARAITLRRVSEVVPPNAIQIELAHFVRRRPHSRRFRTMESVFPLAAAVARRAYRQCTAHLVWLLATRNHSRPPDRVEENQRRDRWPAAFVVGSLSHLSPDPHSTSPALRAAPYGSRT